MPTFKVTVLVEMDDVPLPNFPVVRRITTQAAEPLRTVHPSGAGFTTLPSGEMASIAVAILQATQPLTVAFIPSSIQLNSTGIMVWVDCALQGVAVQNTSGSSAQITALLAGT